jgi:hypothetical protein
MALPGDALGGACPDRHHGDDGAHTNDDAKHGQGRAELVDPQGSYRDSNARKEVHLALSHPLGEGR